MYYHINVYKEVGDIERNVLTDHADVVLICTGVWNRCVLYNTFISQSKGSKLALRLDNVKAVL